MAHHLLKVVGFERFMANTGLLSSLTGGSWAGSPTNTKRVP